MRYLCVHCDHRWEIEGDEAPKRCPSCMRTGGIEPVRDVAKAPAGGSRTKLWLGLAVVAALAIAGVVLLKPRSASETATGGLRALDADDLQEALVSQQVVGGGLENIFVADDAMRAFAKAAVHGESSAFKRAEAMTKALRARQSALAFVPWSLGEPRPTPVMLAKDVFAAMQKDKGRAELYPLEVAALEVALLRTLDVPAMLAELADLPNERAPLDPSGYLGYFVVAVYEAEPGHGPAMLYDPYGGRALTGNEKHIVLSDPQVVGAALGLRAVYEMSYLADPKRALDSSSSALHLASTLPSVRTARGVIVLGGKMVEQGLQELEAARQLRADAARLHNLSSALLLTGDVERAEKELTAVLAKSPDYAGAHATVGALRLARGDTEQARAELDTAEKLAPDLSMVQWGMAEFLIVTGERERALEYARRAYERRPSFDAGLRMGVLLRQAGKYDEMRKIAHTLVDKAPDYRKSEVRELVSAVMGPTALEPTEPDLAADDLADLGGPKLELKLGQGSKLLGEGKSEDALQLGGQGGPGDPLILSGDQSKLRLGGSGGKLKLDLGK